MYINGLASTQQTFEEVSAPRGLTSAAGQSAIQDQKAEFGAAVVLESGGAAEDQNGLYGSDGRMLDTLKERDAAVRDAARAEGEAVGGRQFVYQTGPDGRQYAVGSLAHLVRRDGDKAAAGAENPTADSAASSAAANAPAAAQPGSEDAALTEKLRQRDAHVRAHELAHLMAAGGQAQGMPQYTYQTGPDGRAYAIGGSVNISVTRTGDPEHDAREANTARRAATAVGDPSTQDSLVAGEAESMAGSARQRALDSYAGQSEERPGIGFMV